MDFTEDQLKFVVNAMLDNKEFRKEVKQQVAHLLANSAVSKELHAEVADIKKEIRKS